MSKREVDIEALYRQKEEIYEKYKQDGKIYQKEYYKILKKIKYWTDDKHREDKNFKDCLRYVYNKYKTIIDVS